MNEEERKEKIRLQQDEQYLAIGKFVVNYEHLLDAIKFKLGNICGNNEGIKILIEAFPASQTIEILGNLIDWKTKEWDDNNQSKLLFKYLLQDLKALNTKRNSFVHTMWFIGWSSKDSVDVNEITGQKFLTDKKRTFKSLTASEINDATEDCKKFYEIMYFSWSIDIMHLNYQIPPFHECYSRSRNGKWTFIR